MRIADAENRVDHKGHAQAVCCVFRSWIALKMDKDSANSARHVRGVWFGLAIFGADYVDSAVLHLLSKTRSSG